MNKDELADKLYGQLKFRKVAKKDLWFMMKNFIKREKYERCSAIKELLDLQFYEDTQSFYGSHVELTQKIEGEKQSFSVVENVIKRGGLVDGYSRKVAIHLSRMETLQNSLKELWDSIEPKDGVMLTIPFKNKNNLGYLFD